MKVFVVWGTIGCLFLAAVGLQPASLSAQSGSPPVGQDLTDPASPLPGAAPGLNADFVDPQLDVDRWVARFELESREIYSSRNEILRHLGLRPDQRIADVGAGTGFFSLLFAELVGPEGQVYAVDIGPRFLEHISEVCDQREIMNVTPVLASATRSHLPAESVDKVFVCDTYHHFEQPAPTLASIRRALVSGGELVVIDFERISGQSRPWVIDHVRGDKQTFRAEIESAGFEFVEEVRISTFSENYFLRFRKPPAESGDSGN